jgi:YggT family protein
MAILTSLIDILIVILLLRLLILPNEAFFDPIYRLIYRLTDPVLRAMGHVVRDLLAQVLLCLLALVLLRGVLYGSTGALSFGGGIGISLLGFLQLVFQGYMVIWFVSFLSQWSYGSSPLSLIDRALYPFNRLSWRFRISRKYYHPFVVLILFGLYVPLSGLVRYVLFHESLSLFISPYGLVEGLFLTLGLFPFPGFFSLIIIVGALLSWVSPDPSNSIVRAIYGISEPLLYPFRRLVPTLGGLDISPILALLCFQILGSVGQQMISAFMKG